MAVDLNEFRRKYTPAKQEQQSSPNYRYQAGESSANMDALEQFRRQYWAPSGSGKVTAPGKVTKKPRETATSAKAPAPVAPEAPEATDGNPSAFSTWLKSLSDFDPYAGYAVDPVTTANMSAAPSNPAPMPAAPVSTEKFSYTPESARYRPTDQTAASQRSPDAANEWKRQQAETATADRAALEREYAELNARVLHGRIGRDYTAEDVERLQDMERQLADYDARIETMTAPADWSGRQALIEEYNRLDNADYLNPKQAARKAEILAELEAGDAAAGNADQAYSFSERVHGTLSGAVKNIGAQLTEFGTGLAKWGAASVYSTQPGAPVGMAAVHAYDDEPIFNKMYEVADSLGAGAAEDLARAKEGLGTVGKGLVDIGENVLEMAFDAGAAFVTGGSSLAVMGARVMGGSMQEARHAGADLDKQLIYGAASAGVETLTEKMFDGLAGIYGKGIVSEDVIESVVRRLGGSETGQTFLRLLFDAAGEGAEEIMSGVASPVIRAIYTGQVEYTEEDIEEMLYSAAIGFCVGALGGGVSVATGQSATANADNAVMSEMYEQEGSTPTISEEARDRRLIREMQENPGAYTDLTPAQQADEAMEALAGKTPDSVRAQELRNMGRDAYAALEEDQEEAPEEAPAPEEEAQPEAPAVPETQEAAEPETAQKPEEREMQEAEPEEAAEPEREPEAAEEAAEPEEKAPADKEQSYQTAFDMGQSGVSKRYLTEENAPGLTDAERAEAYEKGREAARATAAERGQAAQQQGGARKEGTVSAENLKMSDIRRKFNDSQNTAYRALTWIAKTTGVNISLYESQADSDGNFTDAKGRFQWKDDTIYIDINSGLLSSGDVNDLGRYTMLRTFGHEFTHFIEKWNAERYNEFREYVFSAMDQKGENVNQLIRDTMDRYGNISYEQASREVIAEAMTDIMQDSTLVQQIATENPTVFHQLLSKLRQFVARMKQAFKNMTTLSTREAAILKENERYLDGIVKKWDEIAKGAVENYQGISGEKKAEPAQEKETEPKPVKKAPIKTEKKAEPKKEKPKAEKKGSADAFARGDIFNAEKVAEAAENKAAREIIEKMPEAEAVETQKEDLTNVETDSKAPDAGREVDADRDGSGTVRVSEGLQAESVSEPAAEREAPAAPAAEGRVSGRDGDQSDAERDGRSGSPGSGESGVQRGHDGVDAKAAQEERQREETHAVVEHDVEEKSTVEPGGSNFVIGDSLDLPNGSKARYKANVDAIRLVKQLEAEGRVATPEEQTVLSKYVGWGGIADAFSESKADWKKEYAELKELLTEEEYEAARASTLNAHYTSIPVIKSMYRGLKKMGFKGGRMLEPSSGVGNFVGAMPADMSGSVKSWTMVELDNITGLIAKHLYPQADVRIQGFETAIIPDNFMDVAIGNVPFGNFPITDRAYPKQVTSAIHNYFFAKSLDKVRPGGIVMFITSSFTMNSQNSAVRKYIAKRADLLGAIRLPNNAFSGNAGTQVVTDILVLKKREAGTQYNGVPFETANYAYQKGTYLNEYFEAHPEMIMGEEVTARGMYRNNEYTVNPFTDRGSLESQIDKAFENITGQMDYPKQATPEKTNYAVERADKKTKQGGFVTKDGKLYQNDGGNLTEVKTDEKTAKRITGMLQIRDIAQNLLNAQMQGQTDKSIADFRKQLNKAYDAFVKENGYINSPANRKAIQQDPDRFSLYALENWDSKKKTATKADIFKVDTVKPNRTITHVDTVQEGLIVSRNTTGGIDVALISRLSGRSAEDVTRELIDSEAAFKDRDGNLIPSEQYLSGNVRAKLREAQGMVGLDKDFQHNVDALKAVVPADIPHEAIYVQPGTPWIPASVYSDFAAYMLGGSNHKYYGGPDIQINRSNQTGTFTIDLNNKRLKSNYLNTQKYGTADRSFLNLFDAMMNSRSVTVSRKGADGKSYVDKVATAAANEKIEQIRNEFQKWLWEDEERTKDLEYLYNETFNAIVTPKYDGSNLTVNGLRAGFALKPHQADAVSRVVSSGGNTLLAHRVGAGKTLEMAAAAMKLRELGIVKKPMFAVPKSLVAQWGKEFKKFFPNAKLLVAEQADFTPANRKTFANRISTGNYDAVIVSYEQFEKIPMSDSYTLKMYREQINEIISAIEEAKEEAGQKSMSVKDMEKKRKQLQAKIDKLSDKAKDTDTIEFEQLGVDSIFVDEAHNFKNLFYTTSMNNVSGLGNKDGSKRAFDLYTKVRYLQQLNGGRGIVFATATPVMNSMSEMYIMQKYLQPDLLKQLGLTTFDSWAKQFGEVVNGLEIKPSGQGYRVKQSFSRFKNMSELQLLFRNFADVLTKVPGLPIPTMKGGKVQIIESDAGEFQKEYMKELEKRADNIKNVDPSEDNMLKITSDGRKISYTQRMIDPSLPYEQGCKIYQCADKVLEEYKASKAIKGTQIIFLDMATPKGKSNSEKAAAEETDVDEGSAQLYDDLKARLVKLGIPAKEIAFIHDADTDQKKSDLFDNVNAGRVRVLIGSTGKMGVGMNAQERIVAIHHLDAPWRPGDVEQRDGRAFRQGNINKEVSKYVYVTKGSFDARLWDILGRKATFIDQIMNGENVGREVEDTGEVTLSAAEIKALASDNPLIGEQVQLEKEIKDLESLYLAHNASVAEARKKLQTGKQQRAEVEKRIENAKTDLKNRGTGYGDDDFSMKIGSQTVKDKKNAGETLMAAATAKANKESYTKIGSFAGFDILAIETNEGFKGLLRGAQGYAFNFYPEQTTRMITRLQNMVKGLDTYIEEQQGKLTDIDREVKGQEELIRQPFDKQEALDKKRARYNEIMDILNPKEEQAISESEDDEDNTEYSIRRGSLTNAEVLEMAADKIDTDKLTDEQKNALSVFKSRLDNLELARGQREEMGREYREQQFTKGGSRAEAEKIRNRMEVMDRRIQRMENELVSLENKDVLRSVLNEARKVVEAEERKHGSETLKRYRERRNESQAAQKYRARVRAQVMEFSQLMTRPSNKDIKKHVPAEIQKTLVDFLDSINLSSKTMLATSGLSTTKADQQYLKSMKKLHDAIKENVDAIGLYSGYAELPPDFLDNFYSLIRKTEQHMEDHPGVFVVNEMSAAELKELSQTLRTLKKYITTMNKLHNNAVFQHASDAGEDTVQHLAPMAKSNKSGTAYKFLRFDYMRPSYVFEHFGKGGQSIEHEFRDGQAVQAKLANKVIDFAKETYKGKEVKAWSEDIKSFTLSDGQEISLPVTHIMSLYCLSKREQAKTHIYGDGIRVANYKKNGKVQLDEGHIVSLEDVQQMVGALTPRQIEVADALQKFMSTECAQWGNYVSMARFDVEQFGEENYFPINSDGRYLPATADEIPDNAGLYALLNMGFTKELKENAKNRIILYNIFDVFANHTASMTQYRAFALPVLDALKWFNYNNGETSVRDQLSKAFGAPEDTRAGSGAKGYAESFVLNLIRAYNGTAANGDPYDSTGLKALHRFNRAQIAFNLRVVVQQPTAITRAAMILSPTKLGKGLRMSTAQLKSLAEEMEAHSGIAAWKRLGFYDTNISRGLTELIKQTPTVGDKVTEAGTWGAEQADRFTWAAMWYAAKETVKRSNYETEQEYFNAVTELFEDVIYKTQVVDSVLTKSEFLRAKGFFPRMMGSFMSEPMTTTSMLMDAYYKYTDDQQRGSSRSEAWQKNGKNITKTFAVYAVGQVILAAAQAVMDAWRDDDEYDTENWFSNYFQKYLNAFKNNVIEEMLPFGKIPYVSELYEISKRLMDYAGLFDKWGLDMYGNDISNGWMQYEKYLENAAKILIDKAQGKPTNYTPYAIIYNLLRGGAGMTGYPAGTAWREVQDLWNNTVGYFVPRLKLDTYQRAIDRAYGEYVRQTGVSQKQFETILADADTSGNGSLTQDELGEELTFRIAAGELTAEQAEAIWKTKWNKANSKTFADWKSK